MKSPTATAAPSAAPLLAALVFAGLQLEALVRAEHAPGALTAVTCLATLATAQGENAALTLAWIGWECRWPTARTRAASFAFAVALCALLALEQEAFLLTRARFRGTLDPTAFGSLLPVVRTGLAVASTALVVRLGLLVAAVTAWRRGSRDLPPALRSPRTGTILLATCLALSAWLPEAAHEVARHPVRVFLSGLLARPARPGPPGPTSDFLTPPLLHGTPTPLLLDLAERLRDLGRPRPGRPPDILLVVLESVGSVHLLPDGRPDPEVTPTLAALAGAGVTFPALYGTAPETVPAHIFLQTGGRTPPEERLAWISAYDFQGPSLPRALAPRGYRATLLNTAFDFVDYWRINARWYGYDRTLDPEASSARGCRGQPLSAWGCDDRLWFDQYVRLEPSASPRLLVLANQATHYPYTVPEDRPGPFPSDTDLGRWKNALHYVDGVLATFLARLEAEGRRASTLVAIVGDHGEAFGVHHPGNFLHRSHLYEENIRNFLILVDPTRPLPGLVVHRPGSMGDVAPTLVARAGGDPAVFVGQDLLAGDYRERLHFFQKSAPPEEHGVLDGSWKMVEAALGGGKPRLFDLARDPHEQRDLAAEYPDRLEEYRAAIWTWRAAANADFVRYLPGYEPEL